MHLLAVSHGEMLHMAHSDLNTLMTKNRFLLQIQDELLKATCFQGLRPPAAFGEAGNDIQDPQSPKHGIKHREGAAPRENCWENCSRSSEHPQHSSVLQMGTSSCI